MEPFTCSSPAVQVVYLFLQLEEGMGGGISSNWESAGRGAGFKISFG